MEPTDGPILVCHYGSMVSKELGSGSLPMPILEPFGGFCLPTGHLLHVVLPALLPQVGVKTHPAKYSGKPLHSTALNTEKEDVALVNPHLGCARGGSTIPNPPLHLTRQWCQKVIPPINEGDFYLGYPGGRDFASLIDMLTAVGPPWMALPINEAILEPTIVL